MSPLRSLNKLTNVSLSGANCMEYFKTFPWKMLQDIPRGFRGTFTAISYSVGILQDPVERREVNFPQLMEGPQSTDSWVMRQ